MNSLEVLSQRQQEGWAPGDEDGNKLYAAVDGGGMAGVVSLGALHQLGEEGLLCYFDGFAGSSAGTLNAAYAMTEQTNEGREVYVNYLPDEGFMSMIHPWLIGHTKIADVDCPALIIPLPLPDVDMRVLSSAISRDYPLDFEKLVHDERELVGGISNLDEATAEIFTNHEFKEKPDYLFHSKLLDGAALPLGIVGDYRTYADAGIYWPTTDTIARQRGATHVLSLATGRQPKQATSLVQKAADFVQAKWCAKYSVRGAECSRDAARYRDFVVGRFVASTTIQIENAAVTRVYPEGVKLPSRQTLNKQRLTQGFEAGRKGVILALNYQELVPST